MLIFVPKEPATADRRTPLLPDTVKKLVQLGATVVIEKGLGESLLISDDEYVSAGATISNERFKKLFEADLVLRLHRPITEEVPLLKPGAVHISYLDTFNQPDLIREFARANVSSISMEMIPRTTLAQKMDALSSQANLSGYVAVILAAERLDRIFPMMMTPAGTIAPARVFVIGVGVAGLQAIATAKRLGARVEAFDTRPAVEEQVKSLGAKFVKIDLGETGETAQGYARPLTEEQLKTQRESIARFCAESDVVITTAQVFGRKAPVIVTTDMVKGMKPGSIIVDTAVESGGNVECSTLNDEVVVEGVHVIGFSNLASRVPVHASQMYSNNLGNLIEHFWDKETNQFLIDLENEILKGCLITHQGKVLSESVREHLEKGARA